MKRLSLIDQRFGDWLVLGYAGSKNGQSMWKCKCKCGIERDVLGTNLARGITGGCGCLRDKETSERQKRNIVGQKFGRLKVLEYVGRSMWKCKCDCGIEKNIFGNNLVRGKSKSCGCYNSEVASLRNKMDLTGKKFNLLKVLKDVGRNKQSRVLWLCECVCGNKTIVSANHLTNNHTKSCGCYDRERSRERMSGKNNPGYKHGLTGTKAFKSALSVKRKAMKLNQTPPDADMKEITRIYKIAQDMNKRAGKCLFHVDHVIPLSRGGMHHEFNLQILPAKENLSKGAKILEGKEKEFEST